VTSPARTCPTVMPCAAAIGGKAGSSRMCVRSPSPCAKLMEGARRAAMHPEHARPLSILSRRVPALTMGAYASTRMPWRLQKEITCAHSRRKSKHFLLLHGRVRSSGPARDGQWARKPAPHERTSRAL
jgi:hypothetical protein